METKDTNEVEEGNKLIAEFVEYSTVNNICEYCGYDVREKPFCNGDENYNKRSHLFGGRIIPLKYHSSWDWLHPVLMKIHDECKLYSTGLKFFEHVTIFSTIEQVWQAVVECIMWLKIQKVNKQ